MYLLVMSVWIDEHTTIFLQQLFQKIKMLMDFRGTKAEWSWHSKLE